MNATSTPARSAGAYDTYSSAGYAAASDGYKSPTAAPAFESAVTCTTSISG